MWGKFGWGQSWVGGITDSTGWCPRGPSGLGMEWAPAVPPQLPCCLLPIAGHPAGCPHSARVLHMLVGSPDRVYPGWRPSKKVGWGPTVPVQEVA